MEFLGNPFVMFHLSRKRGWCKRCWEASCSPPCKSCWKVRPGNFIAMKSKVIFTWSSGSQRVSWDHFGGLNDFFTGVIPAYQIFTFQFTTVENYSYEIAKAKIRLWLGVTTTWGIELKVRSVRKVEKHWPRLIQLWFHSPDVPKLVKP